MSSIAALAFAFSVFLGVHAHAATFYLATGGSDEAVGAKQAPWKSLQKAVWKMKAGDTLIVRGGTYRDSSYGDLLVPSKGKITTIKAATGEKVIFDGRVQGSEALKPDWRQVVGNTWQTYSNGHWRNLDGLWVNDKFYPRAKKKEDLNKGSWFLSKDTKEVLVNFKDGETPANAKLELRMEAMITVNTPYWLIEGIQASYFNYAGITVWKTHHVTIRNCEAHRNGGSGIEADEATDLVIEGNHTSYNGADGGPGWASGIHLWMTTSPNNVVRGNLSHHNWDPSDHHTDGNGFSIDRGKERGGADVYNNIAYSNGGRGIDIVEISNVKLHHNTFFDNSQDPLMADQGEVSISESVATIGFEFHDNVLIARRRNRPFVAFGGIDLKQVKGDFNLVFNPDTPELAFAQYGKRNYTMTEWRQLTGSETQSQQTDPKLSNPDRANFRPQLGSPLIGRGSGKNVPKTDYYGSRRGSRETAAIGAAEIEQ